VTFQRIDVVDIDVQVHIDMGLPGFTLAGLREGGRREPRTGTTLAAQGSRCRPLRIQARRMAAPTNQRACLRRRHWPISRHEV